MPLMTFLLALTLFVIILAAVPFKVRFSYLRVGADDTATIGLSGLLGLLQYKFELPMLDWRGTMVPHLRLQTVAQSDKGPVTKEVKPRRFNRRLINKIIGNYFSILRELRPVRRWFYRGIRCSHLRCVLTVGLKDAAHTGLAVGGAWSLIGYYLGKLHNSITFEVARPQVAVYPSFCESKFDVDIDCIFKVRVGHIIVTGFKLIRVVKLGLKGGRVSESSD